MQTLRVIGFSVAAVATLTAATATSVALDGAVPPGVPRTTAAVTNPAAAPTATAPPLAPPTTLATPDVASGPTASEPPDGALRRGDTGPRTRALQEQLVEMGYWLGAPDGTYGDLTVQAVTALQKVHGMARDGVAGPAVAAALASASPRPAVAGDGSDRVEIDKRRQVLFVVRAGEVKWVLNVSTGTEKPYRVNGRMELADTPAGRWAVTRAHDGMKAGELGSIYRPRYFHRDGIAVHGYGSVPAVPASHGCVRVSKAAMDWIWSADLMPVGSPVLVY